METQLARWLAGILFCAAVGSVNAGLEFLPKEGVYIGEATPFRCIRFRDGEKSVRFMPPEGWIFTADGASCAFRPPGVTQANGGFSAKPRDDSKPLAERLEQLLRQGIPEGAEKIACVLTGLPQVKLDEWASTHVEATYEHFGQTFRIALVVAQMKTEEIHARFGCRAADFEKVFPPFFESLGTFTWEAANSQSSAQAELVPQAAK